jgi:alpha-galactosidase
MNDTDKFWSSVEAAHRYIVSGWPKAVHQPSPDPNNRYALPFVFVPPSVSGTFQWLFYWDTFYTNRGLLLDGHIDWAKGNVDNLIYMLNRYGFVPNSNSENGIKYNSQPPYLHFMVKDIFKATGDLKWLASSYEALKKEYAFWMKERMSPCGLNRHGCHASCSEADLASYYDYVANERLPIKKNLSTREKATIAPNYIAMGEMGLDYTPRLGDDGAHCCPADLNANLYGLELDLAEFAERLGKKNEAQEFKDAAAKRQGLMDSLLLSPDGLYYDYNFAKKIKVRPFCFTGQFMAFITGLSHDNKALHLLFKKLLMPHGMTSCEQDPSVPYDFQANYPYSWPYDNYLAFWALTTCGLDKEATLLAQRYLANLAGVYSSTGLLWETYDAVNGGIAHKSEYPATEMLGWTAGSFEAMYDFLKKRSRFATDISTKPDNLSIETDEGEVGDAKVEFVPNGEDLEVYLTASSVHPRFVKMRWAGEVQGPVETMGDQFGRLQSNAFFGPLNPERYFAWYYLIGHAGDFACGGVKTLPNALISFSLDQRGVNAYFDCRCGGKGVELQGRRLLLGTIVFHFYANTTAFSALRRFCQSLSTGGIFPKTPFYGGNDWYSFYGKSTLRDILASAHYLASLTDGCPNPATMVIDDGWEEGNCGGPWSPNSKFVDMEKAASGIKVLGLKAGIWIRFLCNPEVLKVHPGWAIKKPGEEPLYLDPSIPGVLTHVKKDIDRIKKWGFDFIKHDYSAHDMFGEFEAAWNGAVDGRDDWSFADRSRTSAEILKDFYRAIHEDCTPQITVEGCNTFSHLCVGYVEVYRTGDDTSGENWDRTRSFGVNSLAFRLYQNNIFYCCDADCAGFGGIDPQKVLLFADLLARSGTPLLVSCSKGILSLQQEAQLKEDFRLASCPVEGLIPLDWEWNIDPALWNYRGEILKFDWQLGEPPRLLATEFYQTHH